MLRIRWISAWAVLSLAAAAHAQPRPAATPEVPEAIPLPTPGLAAAGADSPAPVPIPLPMPAPSPMAGGDDDGSDADSDVIVIDKAEGDDAEIDAWLPIDDVLDGAGEVIEMSDSAPIEATPPGAAALDRTQLQTVPGARGDAIAAVQSLPGVASVTGFGGAGNLVVRGASPEETLYLVDGVEIPLVSHFGDVQTVLPSEMIESIEFAPGGFGVEHGRATGAVLEIKTRPTELDRMSGVAEVSFINASGFVQGPISREHNLSFSLGFRRSFIDLFLPVFVPDDAGLAFTTAPNYYDAQARVDWRPSYQHELSLLVLDSSDRLDFVLDRENPDDRVFTGTLNSEDGFRRIIARWRYRGESVDATTVAAYGSSMQRRELNGEDYFYRLEPELMSSRTDLRWRLSPGVTAKLGAEAQLFGGQISARVPLPGSEGVPGGSNFTVAPLIDIEQPIDDDRFATWAALDLRPIDGLVVSPGVRADHYRHIDATTILPRVAASYRLTPAFSLRGSVGAYSRPLNYAEALPDDLAPERSQQYVAGGEYQIAPGLSAVLTGFYTKFDDLVVQNSDPMVEDPLEQYQNQGTGRAYGSEITLRGKRDNFFGWIAYTLSRSTRTDGPGQRERLLDWDQTHNLVAVASWELGPWRLGGKFRYASGTPDTPIAGAIYLADYDTYEPIWGPTNSQRMDSSHQLDLRVERAWQFRDWRLSTFVDVANVYANSPVLGYSYNFDYSQREAVTGLPFLPSIGLKGAF